MIVIPVQQVVSREDRTMKSPKSEQRTPPPPTAGLCVLVSAEELSHFAEIIPKDISVFGVASIDDDAVTLIDAFGATHSLAVGMTLCLGFLATDRLYLDKLDHARRVLEAWSGLELPSPALIQKKYVNNSLAALLSTALVNRLSDYAAHSTRLSRELFRLRAVHEDMLNTFAGVESFIGAANIQPCRLTFESLPHEGHIVSENAISQLLPVSTTGLSVIQLHIASGSQGPRRIGGLNVELRSLEDREVHKIWEIPFEDVLPGWITFTLDRGLSGAQRTPQLIIRPLGGLGALPPISLGVSQPLAAYRPRLANDSRLELASGSLALRTWSGLPGIRPPNLDLRSEGRSHVEELAVPYSFFADVRNISKNWTPGFQPVAPVPEARGLLCHPPPKGATWGELDKFPAGDAAFRLSVRALLRNKDANPTEFALAFSSGAEEAVRQQIVSGQDPVVDGAVFSGWQLATPTEPTLLSIQVLPGQGALGSIFFGTRIADGRGNAYAWATFIDLRKTLLHTDMPTAAASVLQTDILPPDFAQGVIHEIRREAEKPPQAKEPSLDEGTAPITTLLGSLDAPQAWLETAAPALPDGVATKLPTHYDPDHRGVICHPPQTGVTMAQFDALPIRERLLFSAKAHVGNDRAESVEFCMIVSPLPSNEVLSRLEAGGEGLTWSGWVVSRFGRDQLLKVDTEGLSTEVAKLFLATRMHRSSSTNNFAWAYFTDVRIARDFWRKPASNVELA